MKHIGIIAEYNPFHNGHLYQINEIKKILPDKRIIICMSGDYVQRGEPAIFTKVLRTECAIAGGADIVIELPPIFASASSEYFAAAGAISLASTGVVDTLCFGAECDDIDKLTRISEFLLSEPDDYKLILKKNLSTGQSYPKARASALNTCFPNSDYDEILKHPNNILAIDYIKAIIKYNLALKPYIIKRTSDNHNLLDTQASQCSSSALRYSMQKYKADTDEEINKILKKHIPETVYNILDNSPYCKPIYYSDFYPYLQYRLINDKDDLNNYHEMTAELANRINNINILPDSLYTLLDLLSGRQITDARIRRSLLNIILSRKKEQMKYQNVKDMINYIRILGVKTDSTHLIKEMSRLCCLPLINKTTTAIRKLPPHARIQFEKAINDSNLYRQVFYNKYGIIIPTDYEQSVIIR